MIRKEMTKDERRTNKSKGDNRIREERRGEEKRGVERRGWIYINIPSAQTAGTDSSR